MTPNRFHRWSWAATSILLVASSAVAQTPEPAPFEPHSATYTVTRKGDELGLLHARLSQRDDGLWHYRIESEATAFRVRLLDLGTTEAGWFAWREDGTIVPLTYHYVAQRFGTDRFWQHRYDWEELHTETRSHEGETRVPLADGALDPLTLRLAAQAAMPEAADAERDLVFSVVERDELETQHYRFLRDETIRIDGRCYDTAVFERFRRPGSSRNYTAWHARELDGLAVRTVHHDDDNRITIELREWSGPAPLPPVTGRCPGEDAVDSNA